MVLISLALTIITRWTLPMALFRVAKIFGNYKKSQCIVNFLAAHSFSREKSVRFQISLHFIHGNNSRLIIRQQNNKHKLLTIYKWQFVDPIVGETKVIYNQKVCIYIVKFINLLLFYSGKLSTKQTRFTRFNNAFVIEIMSLLYIIIEFERK